MKPVPLTWEMFVMLCARMLPCAICEEVEAEALAGYSPARSARVDLFASDCTATYRQHFAYFVWNDITRSVLAYLGVVLCASGP
ncbi:hypothetical protein CC79DRAFT_1329079 [Sarocladium strictum]